MVTRLRLILILVMLVVIPTVVVGWMASRLLTSEEEVLQKRFRELTEGRLAAYDERIADQLQTYANSFLAADPVDYSTASLRDLEASLPLCTGLITISASGDLFHPDPGIPLSDAETKLLYRSRRLLDSGALLLPPEEADLPQQPASQVMTRPQSYPGSVAQQATQQAPTKVNQGKLKIPALNAGDSQGLTVKRPATGQLQSGHARSVRGVPSSGWVPWFRDEGLQLYFRRQMADGWIFGFELNRARLIADVISVLPDTDLSHRASSSFEAATTRNGMALRNSHGKVIYRWGTYDFEEGGSEPTAAIPVSFPLNAWRLEYYSDPVSSPMAVTRARKALVLILGTGCLALFLSLLSAYIYRESNRRMAEAANRVNFVNRVSHELRTPLTNIRMYGELLAERIEGDSDAKAQDYIGTINQECGRLSRLISNVLSFSRRQRQKLEIKTASVDPCQLVQRLLRQFGRAFETCGLTIDVQLDFCPRLNADSDAIEQIMVNLLSNAEKYAASGGRIEVRSRREGDMFVLSVADNGPGIPAKMREKVFAPFVRLSNRIDEGVSGTGIGLAIARDLARLHGGDIRIAESATGACFELFLPLSAGDEGDGPGDLTSE